MVEKIREHVYSLSQYLECVKEEDIREDQDVQRLAGQWDPSMINELIYTVLTGDYILPIIIGEEERDNGTTQLWLVDGLQRTSSLNLFRYGNYKITSVIKHSSVEYQVKRLGESKKPTKDEEGNFLYDTVSFDLKGKTFEMLPKELQKAFDSFQIKTVVHQHCTMERISELVCRYNNHKSMNSSQTAFTYVYKHARKIRNITDHRFFKDCGNYSEKERTSGVYERIVCESVMTMFHLEDWQKQGKKMGAYLNENATDDEFTTFNEELTQLESITRGEFKEIFTSKNSFVWFALFHRFLKYGIEDIRFKDFLDTFQKELHSKAFEEYNNESFDSIDANKATKDKRIIIQKLDMLEKLMAEFLHINTNVSEETIQMNDEEFVVDCTGIDIEELHKDFEFYNDSLNDLINNTIKVGSKLLEPENQLSLLAMIVYSYKEDIDLDSWMIDYARNNNTYIKDQKKNYLHMLSDLKQWFTSKQLV